MTRLMISFLTFILLPTSSVCIHCRTISFLKVLPFLSTVDFSLCTIPISLFEWPNSSRNTDLKEEAIANIALQIAKIGVKIKNRDYLQRAVGLTCDINGQDIRSVALSGIIDEASIFAAQQGDLNLLLRMREWINSLLEKNLAENAMVNIIDGVIQYAIDKHSPSALEEAYKIAKDIGDPGQKPNNLGELLNVL